MPKLYTTTKRDLTKNFHSRKVILSKCLSVPTTIGGMGALMESMVLYHVLMSIFLKRIMLKVNLQNCGPRPRVYPLTVIPHQGVRPYPHLHLFDRRQHTCRRPLTGKRPHTAPMMAFKVNFYCVTTPTSPLLKWYQKILIYHRSKEVPLNVQLLHQNHLRTLSNVHEV